MTSRRRGVLLVMLARRFGGADARVLQLAEAMHGQRPYAVAVLAGSPMHERLAAAGLELLAIPHGRGDPRVVPWLLREMRRRRLSIVDAHNPQSQLWGSISASLARAPVRLCTVHSVSRDSDRGRRRILLYETVLRLAHRLGCRFLAVSPAVAAYLGTLGIPPSRIEVILNGIEPLPAPRPGAGLRERLGWTQAHVVATVGRLEPVKGHGVLLQAIAALRDRRPALRCLLVGDGRERAALERQAATLGIAGLVHFAGFRQDVPALLAECDLFCLPSLSEGVPYALLEALACGVPALATRVGSLPEILSPELAGRLVPPGDPAALAAAIERAIDRPDEMAALARSGQALVRGRFDRAEMIARTLAAYDR
jgi:glycosyltransferase involved in cell wall biosynthesis